MHYQRTLGRNENVHKFDTERAMYEYKLILAILHLASLLLDVVQESLFPLL